MPGSNIFPQHPVDRPFPRQILIPNPAAGADILYACPANFRFEVLGFHFQLTTDATAGNREVDIILGSGVVDYYRFDMPIPQVPTSTYEYHLIPGQIQPFFNIGTTLWCPAPPNLILCRGLSIYTDTLNLVIGDRFTFLYLIAYAFPDLVNMAPA